MLKKILSMSLAAAILVTASSVGVFARANGDEEKTKPAEKSAAKKDLKTVVKASESSATLENPNKSTLADYRRAQKQGNKFSTTTKVLIGVGIAVAVIGIVVLAARNDLRNNPLL
jgi:hypothetical protein